MSLFGDNGVEYIGRPPFIEAGDVSYVSYIRLAVEAGLKANLISFIESVFNCFDDEIRFVDNEILLQQLSRTKIKSKSGVRKAVLELESLGFIVKREVFIKDTNRVGHVFTFIKPSAMAIASIPQLLPHGDKATKESGALKDARSADAIIKTNERGSTNDALIDDLFCSVLFSATKFNRKAPDQVMETWVDWFGEKTKVTTRGLLGRRIAVVTDFRYLIALMSLVEERIFQAYHASRSSPQSMSLKANVAIETEERSEIIKNTFSFDINDINAKLRRSNTGGEIKSCIDALWRLSSTVFELDSMPSRFLERHGLEDGAQQLQAISNLGVYSHLKRQRKSYFCTFELNDYIFESLKRRRNSFYRFSPVALQEHNEFIFAFHLWCRRRLGRRPEPVSIHRHDLHDQIAPAVPYNKFMNRLEDSLLKFPHSASNSEYTNNPKWVGGRGYKGKRLEGFDALVHGYIVVIRGDRYIIQPDNSDPWVGEKARKRIEYYPDTLFLPRP